MNELSVYRALSFIGKPFILFCSVLSRKWTFFKENFYSKQSIFEKKKSYLIFFLYKQRLQINSKTSKVKNEITFFFCIAIEEPS